MVKDLDEDKAFEQKLKGKMGWKCSCSLDIVCKGCGKVFKTDRDVEYCFSCDKKRWYLSTGEYLNL